MQNNYTHWVIGMVAGAEEERRGEWRGEESGGGERRGGESVSGPVGTFARPISQISHCKAETMFVEMLQIIKLLVSVYARGAKHHQFSLICCVQKEEILY